MSPGRGFSLSQRVDAVPREPDLRAFRCTRCGDCCRIHRVPLTAADLCRLIAATGTRAASLVDWLAPGEVDMTGEPESFVVLPEGRRLPVLAHLGGACALLEGQGHCSAHDARPATCRTFPLESAEGPPCPGADGVRRLSILPGAACPGTFDGAVDEDGPFERLERRQRELEEHVELVVAWNRRQRRRQLARVRQSDAGAFLTFILGRGGAGAGAAP